MPHEGRRQVPVACWGAGTQNTAGTDQLASAHNKASNFLSDTVRAVMRIRDFYPGSEFFQPGYMDENISVPRIRNRIKEFLVFVFKPKNCYLSSRKYDRDVHPESRFFPSRIQNPEVKKAPDSGSWIRIRKTGYVRKFPMSRKNERQCFRN